MRVQDERPLNMTDEGKSVQLSVTPNPFPSFEVGGPMHAGLEGTIVLSDSSFVGSDIKLRLEIYNDNGEIQEIEKMIPNVRVGESRSFFKMISADFNFSQAKVRLKSVSLSPAEDRPQDVFTSISRLD